MYLITECAGEFAVDVEGAPAHTGDCTHFLDTLIGEFADDERFAEAEGVAEDTSDLDAERLGCGAAEDGPDFAALAGLHVIESKGGGAGGLRTRGGLGGLGEEKLKRGGRGERGEQEQPTERETRAHEVERDGVRPRRINQSSAMACDMISQARSMAEPSWAVLIKPAS